MKYLYSLFAVLIFFLTAGAQDFPEPMIPRQIVNDFTGQIGRASCRERVYREV